MIKDVSSKPKIDPFEEMKQKMGISTSQRGTKEETELDRAFKLFTSDNYDYRIMGLHKILELKPELSSQILHTALNDPSEQVKREALLLYGKYKVNGGHNILFSYLMSSKEGLRTAAVASLTTYKSERDFIYQLQGALSSSNPEIVISAISVWNSIASEKPIEAKQAIMPVLYSNDEKVLEYALDAITYRIPDDELKTLEPNIKSISARMWGTPVGDKAKILLHRIQEIERAKSGTISQQEVRQ